MTHHRSSKPHKLLLSPLIILLLPTLTQAQIASYFPPYLKSCIDRCQPLWSANYDCTLSGQSSLDCLCQSSWVEQFYEGSTCTCTSDFESQEFRNWFQGTGGCSVYVEARIRSSETSVPTSTVESSSSSSSTEEETTTTSERTSRRTTSSVESTTTSDPDSTTTRDSTFTTLPVTTGTGTRGSDQTGPPTTTPTLTGAGQDSSTSFITEQNKRWVIPTIVIGGLIVIGAGIFAFLFFCCGCCRRGGRGRYSKANNSSIVPETGSAAGAVLGKRKKKRMWLSTIPFFGVNKSNRSDGSGDTLVGDPYDSQNPYQSRNSMVDTGYYGAGSGLMGLGGDGGAGGPYIPYQHGAPLPPIDEVQSIAESTVTRDRGLTHARSPLADEDEPFQFGYGEQQGVSTYSPVGNGGRESMVLPPMPVHQGFGEGIGLIGTAVTTSNAAAAAAAAENRSRRENGDMSSFSNRYEDLATRRMDRRMFDPFGNPMPMSMDGGGGAGMVIPRKEIRSTPTTPVGEQVRSLTVSPPASTVSIASSSGFGGGGGPLAGRGGSSGGFSGFPRAPAPAGSGLFTQQPGRRPGDYYEDYR
ncbi:hypothetical protein TWF506_004882 [Arthrobotrys conoides]|uniref:Extracellular membrane protein CFEM domain-containing protein n=1 Tax=Arthrobotrys conoides TaxID=74498 RepID=A0AAN8NAR9_9PEZI